MKPNTKLVAALGLCLLLALGFTASAFAGRIGNEGGGGGGVLARLLVAGQTYLIQDLPKVNKDDIFPESPELRALYSNIRNRIVDDVRKLTLKEVATTVELVDPHFGYKTWIRIHGGEPAVIEYNPSPKLYRELVESQEAHLDPDANRRRSNQAPRMRDVISFLLHEMGHFYGLNEEQAWRFAFGLQKELERRSGIRNKDCTFSYTDTSIGAEEILQENFKLGSMDSSLLTTKARTFTFTHVLRPNAKPQLMVSVTNFKDKNVELTLFTGAESEVSLMQTFNNQAGFINLQCVPTETTRTRRKK